MIQSQNPGTPFDNPFSPPPEGHAKTMSQVLGEIVWLTGTVADFDHPIVITRHSPDR